MTSKLPLNLDTFYLIPDKNILIGGSPTGEGPLNDYFENVINKYAYCNIPGDSNNIYLFEVLSSINRKIIRTISGSENEIIASGEISLAIGYILKKINKQTLTIVDSQDNNLKVVLKTAIINKKYSQEERSRWIKSFIKRYLHFKEDYGNCIPNMKFYGDTIEVFNNKISDSKGNTVKIIYKNQADFLGKNRAVWQIWEYCDGNLETIENLNEYILKVLGVSIYAYFILKRIIVDLHFNNILPGTVKIQEKNIIIVQYPDQEQNSSPVHSKPYYEGLDKQKKFAPINYLNFITRYIFHSYYKLQLFILLKVHELSTYNKLYVDLLANPRITSNPQILLRKNKIDDKIFKDILKIIFSNWVKKQMEDITKPIIIEDGYPYFIKERLDQKYNIPILIEVIVKYYYNITYRMYIQNLLDLNRYTPIKNINKLCSFTHQNNIAILWNFLKELDKRYKNGIELHNKLKNLLFNSNLELGILATSFADIPPYIIAFTYLIDIFNFKCDRIEGVSNPISIFKQIMKENIGSSISIELADSSNTKYIDELNQDLRHEIFKYNDEDSIRDIIDPDTISVYTLTYDKWQNIRNNQKKKEISLNNINFCSKEVLFCPPKNSIFNQNIAAIGNSQIMIPLFVLERDKWIENPNIKIIKTRPEEIIQIFELNIDLYRLYNIKVNKLDYIPYIKRIKLSRELTLEEEKEIYIKLNPEERHIYVTPELIDLFMVELETALIPKSELLKLEEDRRKKFNLEYGFKEKGIYIAPSMKDIFKRRIDKFNKENMETIFSTMINESGSNLKLIKIYIQTINWDDDINEILKTIKSINKQETKKEIKEITEEEITDKKIVDLLGKVVLLNMLIKIGYIVDLINNNKLLLIEELEAEVSKLKTINLLVECNVLSEIEFKKENFLKIKQRILWLLGRELYNNSLKNRFILEEIYTIKYTIEEKQKK